MYVKTDYDGCEYITAGKVYEVYGVEYPWIKCDNDDEPCNIIIKNMITGDKCPHLDYAGTWTICDKEGNEL